jgi:hypothetical protein
MTGNGTTAGGYIFTINLASEQSNTRWKAYVGNVTGTLVLADSDGYSVYDWSITTSFTGEVYATRNAELVSWSDIGCANITHIYNEEIAMNHTSNPNDNISTTFSGQDNDEFEVGTTTIGAGDCWTTNLYVNSSAPTDDAFEQVLLYDGTDASNGDIVYTSIIEDSHDGYREDTGKYDFEMILPEKGYSTWTGATAYYFYVELA